MFNLSYRLTAVKFRFKHLDQKFPRLRLARGFTLNLVSQQEGLLFSFSLLVLILSYCFVSSPSLSPQAFSQAIFGLILVADGIGLDFCLLFLCVL